MAREVYAQICGEWTRCSVTGEKDALCFLGKGVPWEWTRTICVVVEEGRLEGAAYEVPSYRVRDEPPGLDDEVENEIDR